MKNYYEILGISKGASEKEIRQAYIKLARIYHPDMYRGDPQDADEKMKLINEAYEVLKDSGKRSHYDFSFDDSNHNSSANSQKKHEQSKETHYRQEKECEAEQAHEKEQEDKSYQSTKEQDDKTEQNHFYQSNPQARDIYEEYWKLPFFLKWPVIMVGLYISGIYEFYVGLHIFMILGFIRMFAPVFIKKWYPYRGGSGLFILFMILYIFMKYPIENVFYDETVNNTANQKTTEADLSKNTSFGDVKQFSDGKEKLYDQYYPVYLLIKYKCTDQEHSCMDVILDGVNIYQCSKETVYPLATVLRTGEHTLTLVNEMDDEETYTFTVKESEVLGKADEYITLRVEQDLHKLYLTEVININQIKVGKVSEEQIEEVYRKLVKKTKNKYIPIGDFEKIVNK